MTIPSGEPGPAMQKWMETLNGAPLVYHQEDNSAVYCDSCAEKILPNRPLTVFTSNRDIHGQKHPDGGLTIYRLHCDECTPGPRVLEQLQPSAVGWFEILFRSTLSVDSTILNPEPYWYSLPTDGCPYDPKEVYNLLAPVDVETHERVEGASPVEAPLDVIDWLSFVGFDYRDVIDPEEGFIRPPQEEIDSVLDRMRERTEEGPEHVNKLWRRTREYLKSGDTERTIVDEEGNVVPGGEPTSRSDVDDMDG